MEWSRFMMDVWNNKDVMALLHLERLSPQIYRNSLHDSNKNGRAFGGQLMGQAMRAAQACGEGKQPAMLRVLFLQGADIQSPIDYSVTPLQAGKRFASCHVRGQQGDRLICDAQLTFQLPPPQGIGHVAPPPPEVPGPAQLVPVERLRLGDVDWSSHPKPCLEMRLVAPETLAGGTLTTPTMCYWLRLRQALPDDDFSHAAALAYLSDFWINSAAICHNVPLSEARGKLYVASLNHSLWFHQPCRVDDWLLFVCESPSLQSDRALTNVRVYDQGRRLVASIAQDCLVSARS